MAETITTVVLGKYPITLQASTPKAPYGAPIKDYSEWRKDIYTIYSGDSRKYADLISSIPARHPSSGSFTYITVHALYKKAAELHINFKQVATCIESISRGFKGWYIKAAQFGTSTSPLDTDVNIWLEQIPEVTMPAVAVPAKKEEAAKSAWLVKCGECGFENDCRVCEYCDGCGAKIKKEDTDLAFSCPNCEYLENNPTIANCGNCGITLHSENAVRCIVCCTLNTRTRDNQHCHSCDTMMSATQPESSRYIPMGPEYQVRPKPQKPKWCPTSASELEWNRLKKVMEVRQSGRLMMAIGGHPSIGKTWAAENYGLDGRGVYVVTLNEDTFAADIKGCAVRTADGMDWFDGPALRAYRNGGRLVVNEIQRAATNVLSFLIELTDSINSSKISLPPPSRETIKPHPRFQVVASYNGSFDDMPEALRSRFSINVTLESPNPDAILALPEDLQMIAARTVTAEEDSTRLSMRHWYEFAQFRTEMDEDSAAWAIFGKNGREILNQIKLARG